jgi:hypothetical protein
MGYEERCNRDAKDMYPTMDLLAMSARSGSWEPSPFLAAAVMRAALDLAAACAPYVPMPEPEPEDPDA